MREEPDMTTTATRAATRPATRFAGWAGIGFAVTFIAGFLLVAQVPAYDAPDTDWVSWVENDNTTTVIGTMLLTAAGLLLMAFVSSLATHLRGAHPDEEHLAVLR